MKNEMKKGYLKKVRKRDKGSLRKVVISVSMGKWGPSLEYNINVIKSSTENLFNGL